MTWANWYANFIGNFSYCDLTITIFSTFFIFSSIIGVLGRPGRLSSSTSLRSSWKHLFFSKQTHQRLFVTFHTLLQFYHFLNKQKLQKELIKTRRTLATTTDKVNNEYSWEFHHILGACIQKKKMLAIGLSKPAKFKNFGFFFLHILF
jgi:hypothetical protein